MKAVRGKGKGLDKVMEDLNSLTDIVLVNIEGSNNNAANIKALDMKLKDIVHNVQLKGSIFNATSDKVFLEDEFGVIGWKGGEIRQPFYKPTNGWSWHDGIGMLYNGNSNNAPLSQTDDRSSTADGEKEFYFTNGGELNEEFTMNSYGSYFMGTIIKEAYDSSYPSYKVEILLGNQDSGALILTKIKNNLNL